MPNSFAKRLLASCCLFSASAAFAVPVTFTFDNSTDVSGGVLHASVDGVNVVGNAYKGFTASGYTLTDATVKTSSGGLGVSSGLTSDTGNEIDTGSASGVQLGEGIIFDFGASFRLVSATFGNATSTSDLLYFDFSSGAVPTFPYEIAGLGLSGLSGNPKLWSPTTDYTGSQFIFAAVKGNNTGTDNSFYLKSITVEAIPATSVPDQAGTLALLSLALGGLFLVRRFSAQASETPAPVRVRR